MYGKGWIVPGCPAAARTRSLVALMANLSAPMGHVVCCSGEFQATRDGCLSGQGGIDAKKTFWEADALCKNKGWRLCRKEELTTSGASGSCGTACSYDTQYVWADFDDVCMVCLPGKYSTHAASTCSNCTSAEGFACWAASPTAAGKKCSDRYYCPGGAMGPQTWAYARERGIKGYSNTEL